MKGFRGIVILCILLLCLLAVPAMADSLIRIVQPTDGEVLQAGEFDLYCTYINHQPGFSVDQLGDYIPSAVQVLQGEEILHTEIWTPGTLTFTEEGLPYVKLRIETEGEYTLRVSCPGSEGEFDTVNITISGSWFPPFMPDEENPDYSVELETTHFDLDLQNHTVARINYKILGTFESTDFVFYSDHLEDADKKVIRFKRIGDGEFYKNWIEYEAVGVGEATLHCFALVNGIRYDHRTVTFTVTDSSVTPMPEPTAKPTPAPTTTPTAAPTAVPTAEPTADPTAQPTADPTAQPPAAPTDTPAPPTAAPTEAPAVKPGDVTGDGKIDIMDVIRLLKHVSGWQVEINAPACDVTGDGNTDIMDVIRLLKFVSGWQVKLG